MSVKLLITALFFSIVCLAKEPISIGVLPGGDPKAVEKEAYKLAEKLQLKMNYPIQIFLSKSYGGITEALKKKKVDFAILSASTYVLSEQETPLKVLLKKTWNGPYYYSALVVNSKSKIRKIKDLKGKAIAFVDEKSSSGYLYPKIHLKKNKINESDFKNIIFSGNHAASVEMLETGKVDAIAVFSDDEKGLNGAWNRFSKKSNLKVRLLWVSEPIPNDPIVVRADFYEQNPKLAHEFMYNLIEINHEFRDELSEILGSSDLMPATSKQYDPVREMVKSSNLAKEL